MAHRPDDEAGVARALATGIRMTPAERAAGRLMRAPDHPDGGGGNEMSGGADDPIRRIEGLLDDGGDADGGEPPVDAVGDEGEDGDLADGAGEAPDEDGDGAPAAIKPPVSWDAEAKDLFAQLPPELQQTIATRETQRERAIQTAQTQAAHARSAADAEANANLAAAQRHYADHIDLIAQALLPQAPDPAIAAQDAGRYIALRAQYDADLAQHQALMQRGADARHEAERRDAFAQQQEIARDGETLAGHFGERWTDQAQRQALLTGLAEVGAALGYTDLLGEANARDLMALGQAVEWKAKADKFDAIQRRKMAVVRQARDLPRTVRPGAAQPPGSARTRATQEQRARLRETGSVEDAAALIASRL